MQLMKCLDVSLTIYQLSKFMSSIKIYAPAAYLYKSNMSGIFVEASDADFAGNTTAFEHGDNFAAIISG